MCYGNLLENTHVPGGKQSNIEPFLRGKKFGVHSYSLQISQWSATGHFSKLKLAAVVDIGSYFVKATQNPNKSRLGICSVHRRMPHTVYVVIHLQCFTLVEYNGHFFTFCHVHVHVHVPPKPYK